MPIEDIDIKYEFDFDFKLTKDDQQLFEQFMNIFYTKYINFSKLFNSDPKKSDTENIINELTSRFKFLEEHRPKICDFGNLINAIHNFFSHHFNVLRDISKKYNIENEFSIHITQLNIIPICPILIKNDMHYY